MLGRLVGKIIEKQPPHLLIDVQGVGYEVEASMNTFYQLPDLGQSITMHTHLVVREDAQLLYGFYDKDERKLFRTLIKINGVGPKLALTILSSITASDFARSVKENDTARLVKLPGVGKKTAERLVVEMRDKLDDWQPEATLPASDTAMNFAQHAIDEAVAALIALGYKPQLASKAVSQVKDADSYTSEEIIKKALQGMSV